MDVHGQESFWGARCVSCMPQHSIISMHGYAGVPAMAQSSMKEVEQLAAAQHLGTLHRDSCGPDIGLQARVQSSGQSPRCTEGEGVLAAE